jgi:hypothetical protein
MAGRGYNPDDAFNQAVQDQRQRRSDLLDPRTAAGAMFAKLRGETGIGTSRALRFADSYIGSGDHELATQASYLGSGARNAAELERERMQLGSVASEGAANRQNQRDIWGGREASSEARAATSAIGRINAAVAGHVNQLYAEAGKRRANGDDEGAATLETLAKSLQAQATGEQVPTGPAAAGKPSMAEYAAKVRGTMPNASDADIALSYGKQFGQ